MFGAGVDYGADVGPVDAPGAHCAWLSQSVFFFGFGVERSMLRDAGEGGGRGVLRSLCRGYISITLRDYK